MAINSIENFEETLVDITGTVYVNIIGSSIRAYYVSPVSSKITVEEIVRNVEERIGNPKIRDVFSSLDLFIDNPMMALTPCMKGYVLLYDFGNKVVLVYVMPNEKCAQRIMLNRPFFVEGALGL